MIELRNLRFSCCEKRFTVLLDGNELSLRLYCLFVPFGQPTSRTEESVETLYLAEIFSVSLHN